MQEINPSPSQKHLHPGIWITVLVLFAVAVGYFVWASQSKEWPFEGEEIVQQSTNNNSGSEVEGWQTYRNEEYGFEVKYPKDWSAGQRSDLTIPLSYLTKGDSSINVLPTGEMDYGLPSSDPVTKNVTIGGKAAVWKEWTLANEKLLIQINLKTYPNNWISSNRFDIQIKKGELSLANQILTTFKFTNSTSTIYRNTQYGFSLDLPEGWKGYSVLTQSWTGEVLDSSAMSKEHKTGPQIVLRHPKWTAKAPWQDIPIMVFTHDEWKLIEDNGEKTLVVSAAPVGPDKLGQNEKYVFAPPPRWVGFYDSLGQDEAQAITKTFKAF